MIQSKGQIALYSAHEPMFKHNNFAHKQHQFGVTNNESYEWRSHVH